ncbi:MAG TPA: hypothetical protein VEY92_07955 [Pseudoxanthomonas sp.]|nr:hypothetical protein [Pseudoxanthomonas sp.]
METQPIEQAQRQAQWLADFLSKAAGDPVPVVLVLALPGWFVEPTAEGKRAKVIVTNCRSPGFLLKRRVRGAMDDSLSKRVGHALTERYPAAD